MRDSPVTEWSRRSSSLHRRHPVVKIAALLVILIAIATSPARVWTFGALVAVWMIALIPIANLPFAGVITRAAAVMLFSTPFALMLSLAGDSTRAIALIARTYASAMAIVMYAGVTTFPEMLAGLRALHMPQLLVEVVQFVYRYLFVIGGQAVTMRTAAVARGATRWRPAAGAVAVLFARSYGRAEAIHRSMLSRGYTGGMPVSGTQPFSTADLMFLSALLIVLLALRFGADWVSK